VAAALPMVGGVRFRHEASWDLTGEILVSYCGEALARITHR